MCIMKKYVSYFLSVLILSVSVAVAVRLTFIGEWAQSAVTGLSLAMSAIAVDALFHRNIFGKDE